MEALIKNRIEEAAEESVLEISPYIISDSANDSEVERAYERAQEIFIAGATFALQNQWISVEEALPEEKYLVLTRVKTPVGIVHRSDYYINDYWYMCRYNQEEIVTHWTEIPSLKGGE